MDGTTINIEKLKELDINPESFEIKNLIRDGENILKRQHKTDVQKEIYGYPFQRIRKGRPYYYLYWYEYDADGKRHQKSKYLGTALPVGYSLGKAVKI